MMYLLLLFGVVRPVDTCQRLRVPPIFVVTGIGVYDSCAIVGPGQFSCTLWVGLSGCEGGEHSHESERDVHLDS
jgi:hypothetical protein